MQQFTLPILLGGITGFIVLVSGLIGGVSFLLILKRIFLFGLIMGGIGFVIQFLFQKWGVDITTPVENQNLEDQENQLNASKENFENQSSDSDSSVNSNLEGNEKKENQTKQEKSSNDMSFDYTVKDDEEIEFKPLDESLLEKNKTKYIDYRGDKIEYDPKKAAQTIRQLLEEDKAHGE